MRKQFDIASHTLIQRIDNNSASKLSFKMWCTPSFRPSEIIYKKRTKPERHKQANSNSKRSAKSSRTTQSRIFFRNFSLSLTFLLPSFSLSTSLSFKKKSQPVHALAGSTVFFILFHTEWKLLLHGLLFFRCVLRCDVLYIQVPIFRLIHQSPFFFFAQVQCSPSSHRHRPSMVPMLSVWMVARPIRHDEAMVKANFLLH